MLDNTIRVVLSRKGFDSGYGGYPSPILPDGRLISLPIPYNDKIRYSDIEYDTGKSYYDLMSQLFNRLKINGKWHDLTKDTECHLDPDIKKDIKQRKKDWRGLFGQIGAAQTHLKDRVKEGDIFLFYGWFRHTEETSNGYKYVSGKYENKNIIFGYFQIDKNDKVEDWFEDHPHTLPSRSNDLNNTIYVSKKNLSFNPEFPGAGVFNYDDSLVLTKKDCNRSKWDINPEIFKDIVITYHDKKNSWKGDYFQSNPIGQEFVIERNIRVENWMKKLINKNLRNDL